MMRLPNGEVIMHGQAPYDPIKAHEYYVRTRQLKGRKPGQAQSAGSSRTSAVRGNVNRTRQKKELAARVALLEGKLTALDNLIKKKEAILKRDQSTNKKPKTVSKSKAAQQNKQYRQTHKTQLAAKAKAAAKKSGGGSPGGGKAGTGTPDSQKSIKDLKMLSTRVRGQLQAAKAKLRAL